MESSNEERVELSLTLGGRNITPKVPYRLRSTYMEAQSLFNQRFEKIKGSSNDRDYALTVLAFDFAVNYLVERNTKDDKVLAPVMQDLLADIKEALEGLK